MKMVAEYLERVHEFERLAENTDDPKLKKQFLDQAAAYTKLVQKRAVQLGLPAPPPPRSE